MNIRPHALNTASALTEKPRLENSFSSAGNNTPARHMDPSPDTPLAADLAQLLANPQFLTDPVFPKDSYLLAVARAVFPQVLVRMKEPDLIAHIQVNRTTPQVVSLISQWVGCWAMDFAVVSDRGVSGRDEFIDRVRTPIRRAPPGLAAVAVEQHLVSRGVVKIQVERDGPKLPGGAQLCDLKTVGWCVAVFASPKPST